MGHYRSWNVWLPDVRVFARKGALVLSSPCLEAPAGELELVELGPGLFRVGLEDWRLDRLQFDAAIDGQATRVRYNQAALYRAFTP